MQFSPRTVRYVLSWRGFERFDLGEPVRVEWLIPRGLRGHRITHAEIETFGDHDNPGEVEQAVTHDSGQSPEPIQTATFSYWPDQPDWDLHTKADLTPAFGGRSLAGLWTFTAEDYWEDDAGTIRYVLLTFDAINPLALWGFARYESIRDESGVMLLDGRGPSKKRKRLGPRGVVTLLPGTKIKKRKRPQGQPIRGNR